MTLLHNLKKHPSFTSISITLLVTFGIVGVLPTQAQSQDIPTIIDDEHFITPMPTENVTTEQTWSINLFNDIDRPHQWDANLYNVEQLHKYSSTYDRSKIVVAILDTGIDWNHRDLSNIEYSLEYSINPNASKDKYLSHCVLADRHVTHSACSHGTAVAGIIAASANNKYNTAGYSTNLKLLDYSVLGGDPNGIHGTASDLAYAINDAVKKGANIINISGGFDKSESTEVKDAINFAERSGVLVVASAGNKGHIQESLNQPFYPATYDTVIGVGSINKELKRAAYSSIGTQVNIVAPGSLIYTLGVNNTTVRASGTSFAAPIVSSAAIALIRKNKSLSPREIRDSLYQNSNKNLITNYSSEEYGSGILDFQRILGIGSAFTAKPVRISGPSRVETAIEISKATFDDHLASSVIIAQSDNYPDALASGNLAALFGGSLLINPKHSLHPAVKDELQRVLSVGKTVYLIGGEAALTQDIETEIKKLGYNVSRVSGLDRIQTSHEIAERTFNKLKGNPTVLVSNGYSFVPSLLAGSIAPGGRYIHLLYNPSDPSTIDSFLNKHKLTNCIAITDQPKDETPSSCKTRIANNDTEDLSADVAKYFHNSFRTVGYASDTSFPDALTGGLHIARQNGVLLFINTSKKRDGQLNDFYKEVKVKTSTDKDFYFFIYGGNAVINEDFVFQYTNVKE